jgi:hypothetical protein
MNKTIAALAPDLTKNFPRSPRDLMGGFVVAARALDKCRAVIAGTHGEYHFDCPLDQTFFDFSGVDSAAFKEFVATGADDRAVDTWIKENAKVKDPTEVAVWNNKMRYTRPCDMAPELQLFLEGYIPEFASGRPVYVWFDVYDIEEKRLG